MTYFYSAAGSTGCTNT